MPPFNAARYVEYVRARDELMISIAKVMVDNKLDAIVHKSVEHEPSLIKDGINPPYVCTRGVPTLNTFLIFAASMTVPSGFTSNNLPVGITFFGMPYSEPTLLKLAYPTNRRPITACRPRRLRRCPSSPGSNDHIWPAVRNCVMSSFWPIATDADARTLRPL